MTIAKIMEITAESPESFDDAMRRGIERAAKTIDNVGSAWIKDQKVIVTDGRVTSYRVNLKVTFVLKE